MPADYHADLELGQGPSCVFLQHCEILGLGEKGNSSLPPKPEAGRMHASSAIWPAKTTCCPLVHR